MLPSAPVENLETAAWPVHSSSINPPRSDPSCLSSDDFLRAPIFADSKLGRRTDFVSSTVLRWCNASHLRLTPQLLSLQPLLSEHGTLQTLKVKKSPIHLLVQHFFFLFNLQGGAQLWHLFLEDICQRETLHVLFWFCCKPYTTSIGWLMHECKCYFFCNSEIAHGHAWLHHQQLHCLLISRRLIMEKKEVNLMLLGSDLQLRIHLPVEQCSDSDGAIHRAQCVTDCVLVYLCISSLQRTSVGGCV